MFDLGFTELLVVGVVALIVIGPERLPKVARTAGQWVGRLNRFVSDMKQDIDRDLKLEELRKLQAEMRETAQKYEILAEQAGQRVHEEVGQVDRVMQAMAATDGGLAMREYEKIKSETAATQPAGQEGVPSAPVPADPGASPEPAASQEPGGVSAPRPSRAADESVFSSRLDDPPPLDDRPAASAEPASTPGKGA